MQNEMKAAEEQIKEDIAKEADAKKQVHSLM